MSHLLTTVVMSYIHNMLKGLPPKQILSSQTRCQHRGIECYSLSLRIHLLKTAFDAPRTGLDHGQGLRGAIKAQLMKDILPGLLERARNEVTESNLAKMREDVTRELREENRKRFEATGFF